MPHIVKAYDRDLGLLAGKVLEMGKRVAIQLSDAVRSLVQNDAWLAGATVKKDPAINSIQEEVDGLAIRLLLARQPMANDLRTIIASQKIASELERIADYAASIAKQVMKLPDLKKIAPVELIIQMADIAGAMLRDAMSAYRSADAHVACQVWDRDDEMDGLYTGMIEKLHAFMTESGENRENIESYAALLLIARCLERIGDHITNVAENIHFAATGSADITLCP